MIEETIFANADLIENIESWNNYESSVWIF